MPEGGAHLVQHGRLGVLIFRSGDEWTAFESVCPHAGAPLFPQHFDGDCVTCTYHGLRFHRRDGICPEAPGWSLEPVPVRTEAGRVLIRVRGSL